MAGAQGPKLDLEAREAVFNKKIFKGSRGIVELFPVYHSEEECRMVRFPMFPHFRWFSDFSSAGPLNRERNCIVYPINAVSYKQYGIAKDLHNKYPHEDTARRRLYKLSRCITGDRSDPGSIRIQAPGEGVKLPHLIALVIQFGFGPPIEENEIAAQAVTTSRDVHYSDGLQQDTAANRLEYFKMCINKVIVFAMGCKDIDRLIIPAGIGHGGVANTRWSDLYLPIIQKYV